jgi:hypothetical protein
VTELTNSLLRKSPTSSVLAGPPIFMNTIAVGPLEFMEFWVTGGATVAMFDLCSVFRNVWLGIDRVRRSLEFLVPNWAMFTTSLRDAMMDASLFNTYVNAWIMPTVAGVKSS